MDQLRVLVVDDSLTIRALIEEIVDQEPGCEVVGVASDVATARQKIADLMPNVVTLDLSMPGESGFVLLEELKGTQHPPVVVVSSNTRIGSTELQEAFSGGADACFDKTKLVTERKSFLTMLRDAVKSRRLQAQGIKIVRREGGYRYIPTEEGVISYERLLAEHDQIDIALAELLRIAHADIPDAVAAAEALSALARQVKDHVEQEDGLIYARIILTEGDGAADKALSFLDSFLELRADWSTYLENWTAETIAEDPSAFLTDTMEIVERVKRRVLMENIILSEHAARYGHSCSKAYI